MRPDPAWKLHSFSEPHIVTLAPNPSHPTPLIAPPCITLPRLVPELSSVTSHSRITFKKLFLALELVGLADNTGCGVGPRQVLSMCAPDQFMFLFYIPT